MSSATFARHVKRQLDDAIREAHARLAGRAVGRATFESLLDGVRARAPAVLSAPVVDGRHLGVDALLHVSLARGLHVRPIQSWDGSGATWKGAVASLVAHLLAPYPPPSFLCAAWYGRGRFARAKRRWFVAHTRGAPFRSLDLPFPMTRAMEHVFLTSGDHLEIEYALRRAELLGLQAPREVVEAVLATRVGTDLTNGAFWRTVWRFLIANSGAIAAEQIGPVIDFLQAVRHERLAVETPVGVVFRAPPCPRFSLKGRTARSLLRAVEDWHRGLGRVAGGLAWSRSRQRPMRVEGPRREPSTRPWVWELTELVNGGELRAEGASLRHCVGSYGYRCWSGASRIWSLRRRSGSKARSVLTIEVDPRRNAIVQVRGYRNRPASGSALELLRSWALRENLRIRL